MKCISFSDNSPLPLHTLHTRRYDGLKLCDHSERQCASSIQAKATGGSLATVGRHPFPERPPTRASGEISNTDTFPEHRSSTTFSRWPLLMFVCRQAPLRPGGRLVTWNKIIFNKNASQKQMPFQRTDYVSIVSAH